MKLHFRSNTFTKYLLSYIFAFIIPVLISFVFIYILVFDLYRNEVLLNEKSKNIVFRDTMDIQISQLYNMAQQISILDEFSYYFNTDAYNRVQSSETLYGYDFANNLVSNIAFFQNNIDVVVTSNGTCPRQDFSFYLFKYENWPDNVMADDLFKDNRPEWRPMEEVAFYYNKKGNYMTFIYPMPSAEKDIKKTLLFQIKEEDFVKTLNINKADDKRNYLILNSAGDILYSSAFKIPDAEALLKDFVNSPEGERQVEGNGYFSSFIRSTFNGFIYVNILPESVAMGKVNRLKKIVVILFIMTILLGAFVVYFFMYLNYSPVKSLKKFIEKNFSGISGNTDDIEAAEFAMNMLVESSNKMKRIINSSMEALKSVMLHDLLWGEHKNIHAFNFLGEEYGIKIDGESFCVAVFAVEKNIRHLKKEERMLHFIENELKKKTTAYGMENLEINSLIFILDMDGIDERELERVLANVQSRARNKFNTDMTIGLSGKFGADENLHNMYIHAVTAVEFPVPIPIRAGRGAIRPGNKDKMSFMNYPVNEIDKLQGTITDLNIDNFNTLAKYLLNYFEASNADDFISMCILYDIINAIVRALIKIDRDSFAEFYRNNMQHLMHKCSNPAALKECMRDLCDKVSDYMLNKGAVVNRGKIEELKQYIKKHYNEYDFTLQVLADKFNMSLSNAGHYFKKNTGMTLSEYMSKLKFNDAKKMLRNSDETLEEIIEKIGYASKSSFFYLHPS